MKDDVLRELIASNVERSFLAPPMDKGSKASRCFGLSDFSAEDPDWFMEVYPNTFKRLGERSPLQVCHQGLGPVSHSSRSLSGSEPYTVLPSKGVFSPVRFITIAFTPSILFASSRNTSDPIILSHLYMITVLPPQRNMDVSPRQLLSPFPSPRT